MFLKIYFGHDGPVPFWLEYEVEELIGFANGL